MAETNQKLSSTAADIFKCKYSQRQIVVSNNFPLPLEYDEPEPKPMKIAGLKIDRKIISNSLKWFGLVEREPNEKIVSAYPKYIETKLTIEIIEYKMMAKTFKYFGHVISNLKYTSMPFKYMQSKLLGELIGNFSSNSLLKIRFDNYFAYTLDFITKPLINVKSVKFGKNELNHKNQTFPMHTMFPSIQRLYLDSWHTNICNFDSSMPNLKHFLVRLQFHRYCGCDLQENFDNVIKKNAQLKSVEMNFSPRIPTDYIVSVNSLLLNLESLTLWEFEFIDHDIYFENVTTFAVKSAYSSPTNLHFPRLQSLFVKLDRDLFAEWLDFLKEHNHLTRLQLKEFDLNDDKFEQIVNEVPNLSQMSVWPKGGHIGNERISTDAIRKLLENHPNLMEFELFLKVPHAETIRTEFECVEMEWNIENREQSLLFQRSK